MRDSFGFKVPAATSRMAALLFSTMCKRVTTFQLDSMGALARTFKVAGSTPDWVQFQTGFLAIENNREIGVQV